MVITKRGKCETCEAPVTEHREFLENTTIFDYLEPEKDQPRLKGQLLDEVKKFKKEKVLCPQHKGPEISDEPSQSDAGTKDTPKRGIMKSPSIKATNLSILELLGR